MAQNKQAELQHAKSILHDPEFYWNSKTSAGYQGSVRRAEWIRSAAQLGKGGRVLEVGCGTGFFSQLFLQSPIELHSIDISPDLLTKAVERQKEWAGGERAEFRVCDVESMPYPDNHFDAAVGVRVLHHLDMDASFREIRRTLKKGGVIAFCEPNMLNPQIMIQKNVPWIKRMMGDTPDETAFFKWPLRRFLRRRGFEDIRIEPFDFLHPWIPSPFVPFAEKAGSCLERVPALREIAGSLRIFARKT